MSKPIVMPHKVIYEVPARNGRSQICLVCPVCENEVWAYVWSLAGSGKNCPYCGSKHTLWGTLVYFDDHVVAVHGVPDAAGVVEQHLAKDGKTICGVEYQTLEQLRHAGVVVDRDELGHWFNTSLHPAFFGNMKVCAETRLCPTCLAAWRKRK